jgi:hypothetical protein
MGGKHEPPSRRSFYISVATTTLRAAIVIALVVGGVVLIDRAFPSSEGALGAGAAPTTPPPSPTETPPPGQQGGDGEQPEQPTLAGLNIAVRNGTGVTGLAAETARRLERRFDVSAIQIDDAPASVTITTIYYRKPGDRDEAELLADRFFGQISAEVLQLEPGSGVEPDVRIAIYLGTDYATTQA